MTSDALIPAEPQLASLASIASATYEPDGIPPVTNY